MQAIEANLKGDLLDQDRIIFKIPVFQRPYVWDDKKQVTDLLNDIEFLLENPDDEHFIGTLVYLVNKDKKAKIDTYYLIDGQQRITTFILFFKALIDCLDLTSNEELIEDLIQKYLKFKGRSRKGRNISSSQSEMYRLLMTPRDQEDLKNLIDFPNRINKNSHIYKNYRFIKSRIKNWLNQNFTEDDIEDALDRINFVEIKLDRYDNAQKIFASLNSTGKGLSQSDLVRNLLLMDSPDMDNLYVNYWQVIEDLLKRDFDDGQQLDNFLMHYLVSKTNNIVNKNSIYSTFVNKIQKDNSTLEILEDLYDYAKIYNSFIEPEKAEYSQEIKTILTYIKLLNNTTIYPLLLKIFRDYEKKIITENTLIETLKLFLSYIIRKIISNNGTKGLNRFFAKFYRNTFNEKPKNISYLKRIRHSFYNEKNNDTAFPLDLEIRENLKSLNLYNIKNLRKVLLTALENSGNEKISINDVSIEHILPQKVTNEWKLMLNSSEEDYLPFIHNLGNLTLTSRINNSELSNKPFTEKRKILQKNAKANILNKDIISSDKWDVESIKNRANRLTDLFLEVFEYPNFNDLDFEKERVLDLDYTEENLKYSKLVGYTFNDVFYEETVFKNMFLNILKLLNKENNGAIDYLAEINYGTTRNNNSFLSKDRNKVLVPYYVENDVYVNANLSSTSLVKRLKEIKNYIGDTSSIKIFIKHN